jgi:hypothetical protein
MFRVSDDGPSRWCGKVPGPSSESLQGRNLREVGRGVLRAMEISAEVRLVMAWPTDRSRSGAEPATVQRLPGLMTYRS